jgi:hypothetical protein
MSHCGRWTGDRGKGRGARWTGCLLGRSRRARARSRRARRHRRRRRLCRYLPRAPLLHGLPPRRSPRRLLPAVLSPSTFRSGGEPPSCRLAGRLGLLRRSFSGGASAANRRRSLGSSTALFPVLLDLRFRHVFVVSADHAEHRCGDVLTTGDWAELLRELAPHSPENGATRYASRAAEGSEDELFHPLHGRTFDRGYESAYKLGDVRQGNGRLRHPGIIRCPRVPSVPRCIRLCAGSPRSREFARARPAGGDPSSPLAMVKRRGEHCLSGAA